MVILDHIVYKGGLLVDPMNIVITDDLLAPTSVCDLRTKFGHTRYYTKFMRNYAMIIAPLEKSLKKESNLHWSEE